MTERISKTQQALALIDKGMSVLEAAREAGVSPQAVHAAIKKIECEREGICPHCYQPLPE